MKQSHFEPISERVINSMVELARCSKRHRILVAGSQSHQMMIRLHQCGYYRIDTTTNCGLPRSQYDVALVDWRGRSMKALETTLDWLVNFLSPAGVLVLWIECREAGRALSSILERYGFRAEAGTRGAEGVEISACRRESPATAEAA